MSDHCRRSIAEQKESIGRLSVDRTEEMSGLARCRSADTARGLWAGSGRLRPGRSACALRAADHDALGTVADDDDLWKLFCTTLKTRSYSPANAASPRSEADRVHRLAGRDARQADGGSESREPRRGFRRGASTSPNRSSLREITRRRWTPGTRPIDYSTA